MLCCPVCRGDLALAVREEREGDILAGSFHCATCGVDYPIDDGIPDLLPPDQRD